MSHSPLLYTIAQPLRGIGVRWRKSLVAGRVLNTASVVQVSVGRQVGVVHTAQIQCDGDPSEKTILNVVCQLDVFDKRIVIGGGLFQHPSVELPCRVVDCVGVVGVSCLNLLDERVVKVQLTDVQRCGILSPIGVVGEYSVVGLHNQVEMCDSVVVVTREKRVVDDNSIVIRHLNTTQEGRVQSSFAIRGVDAGVCTSGIAVPDISENLGGRLAGIHVQELEFDVHRNTRLTLGDVGANLLSCDIVRANRRLRDQRASVVAAKDRLLGSFQSVARAGHVVAGRSVLLQHCQIPFLVGHGLWWCCQYPGV